MQASNYFFRNPVNVTGPKCFHCQTVKKYVNAVVSSVAFFGSGHKAISNSLDVQFLKLV